ncbi:MAG: DUF3105 domain-containing protein [Polyangia bacterium]
MRTLWAALFLLAGAALAAPACGADVVTPQPPLCPTETRATADEGALHVSTGTAVSYGTNPPASGPHYPVWGRWGEHTQPLPRGNYVHNLEHGGVVLLYRCDAGCPDTVAALRGLLESWPQDPACQAPVRSRLVLTPDPLLDVPVAAAAWQNIYRADCVDLPSLRAFITAHYDRAPESLCADGSVP